MTKNLTEKKSSVTFDDLINSINKQFGENTIGLATEMKELDVERIPSGSLFLDWALGANKSTGKAGWALGRVVELYGLPSSGKSLICLRTIAEAQKLGLTCAYMDCENTFDKDFAEAQNVDVSKLVLSQASIGEEVVDVIAEMLKSEQVHVIVVDSVATLIPRSELEESMDKQTMALTARMMSKALRKITALNKNTLVLFINQLRTNPGVTYGNPEYTPGGKALGYFASLRVEVRKGEAIVDEDTKQQIGQVVKFKVTKNKTAVPFRDGYFNFLYSEGVDKVDELVSLGLLNGKINRRGSMYDLVDIEGETSFKGREELQKAIRDNNDLFEKAKKSILGL